MKIERLALWAGIQPPATGKRLIHAFIGAVLGIVVTAMVMRLCLGGQPGNLPLVVAPIGASAVLLFAIPASPLAQPWAIIGGNTISALCGIFCAKLVGDPTYAAGIAVASAIAMMSLARCLHPPGGAVALTGVIGGPAVAATGWSFALTPVALDSILLVAVGCLYHAITRSNYPHDARKHALAPPDVIGYAMEDLETVLAQNDQLLDISADDLDTLFRQVEDIVRKRSVPDAS